MAPGYALVAAADSTPAIVFVVSSDCTASTWTGAPDVPVIPARERVTWIAIAGPRLEQFAPAVAGLRVGKRRIAPVWRGASMKR